MTILTDVPTAAAMVNVQGGQPQRGEPGGRNQSGRAKHPWGRPAFMASAKG